MDLYAVLLLFLFVFFVLFLYVRWNDNYWLKRGIPFIEPGKIFGNIREVVLMRKTIGQVYREIYKKLGDKPLGGFFKLRQPMLMIKDPELIKEVLSDKFDSFNSNDINVRRDTSPILKMNPLLSSGATWRASKSVLTPLTHDKTLDGMFEISKIISQDMVTTMKIHPLLPVECKKLSARYITNVIASCALGMETSTFKKENPEFSEMSSKIFRNTLKSNIALLFALYAPNLSNWFLYRFIPQKITQYFINMISNMCKYRVKESVERKDFLQHLININKESEANGEGTVYNYDKITAYCMTILLNGYFMSNSPLYYCLYEIASNNEIQKKLKNELKENNVRTMEELSSEKMKRLKYLDMVFSETLRLHPPVQVITRLCNKETILKKDGIEYKIEPGTPVTIPIYALHMDQKHYKDPERFLPERFTEDAFKGDFTYLPFGKGPRECPGARFGVMVIKIALVAILLKFTIELRDPSMELKQDPRSSLLNTAQGEVLLRFEED